MNNPQGGGQDRGDKGRDPGRQGDQGSQGGRSGGQGGQGGQGGRGGQGGQREGGGGSGRTGGPRFGLATMRERAQAIGGALEIMSRRGEGSRVELRWQRSRREPEEHHVR